MSFRQSASNNFHSGVQDQVSSLGVRNIPVTSIRMNERNFYAHESDEAEMVQQMEELLKSGQASNIVVYQDEEPEDDKKYTLISGERRCKAMLNLLNSGESDGMISAKIINKPTSNDDEMLQLISGNAQRAKSKSIRTKEIQELQNIWNSKREREETTGRFVDWAGALTGMSARSVANYLKRGNSLIEFDGDITADNDSYDPVETAKLDLKQRLDELSEALTNACPFADKIKISPTMTVTIKCTEIGPLEDLIDALGMTEIYQNGFIDDIPNLVSRFEESKKKKG